MGAALASVFSILQGEGLTIRCERGLVCVDSPCSFEDALAMGLVSAEEDDSGHES